MSMMKKLSWIALGLVSSSFYAQTTPPLRSFPKVEIGLMYANIGYETPVSNNVVADLNLGYGGVTHPGKGYILSEKARTAFLRGGLRYYFNREARQSRGHSLVNNAGSFIGYQTKFSFKGIEGVSGETLLNEIHFGQQLPLGPKIIFRYHLGLGYGYDLGFKTSSFYPGFAINFGYAF